MDGVIIPYNVIPNPPWPDMWKSEKSLGTGACRTATVARAAPPDSDDDDDEGEEGESKAKSNADLALDHLRSEAMSSTSMMSKLFQMATKQHPTSCATATSKRLASSDEESSVGGGRKKRRGAGCAFDGDPRTAVAAAAEKAGAGRKARPISAVVSDHLTMLAHGNPLLFGERRDVALRSLCRYLGLAVAAASASAVDDPEGAMKRSEVKTLQLVESCVKLYCSWDTRSTTEDGFGEFVRQWESLTIFNDQPPQLKVESPFIWKLYYEVHCTQGKSLGVEVSASRLNERFPTCTEQELDRFSVHSSPRPDSHHTRAHTTHHTPYEQA